jgi:prophage tail gpP-like protein
LGKLGLNGKLLFQLLDFALLCVQEGVAAPAFGIDALLFLIVETTFGFDEFLHGLSSEIQD